MRRLRRGAVAVRPLRAGDALGEGGRYLLLEPIGRGGFASVWQALDRERNERVAVKVLHANLAGDPLCRDRFLRGARVMADLEHHAVVRVLEPHGEDLGWYYFVMELVSGGDLRQAVLAKRVPRDQEISLILRVGDALAVAHAHGMVHRDIKPGVQVRAERVSKCVGIRTVTSRQAILR